jgi:cell division protein FtsW (lipid II flippase)
VLFAKRKLNESIQSRLLVLAAVFLFLYSLALTFSPAVRARSWNVDLRWSHWIGLGIWALAFALAQTRIRQRLPESDPLLLPIASLMSGWGLLTIWRLDPVFGLRQTGWLAVSIFVLIASLHWNSSLNFLRRYRYLWLLGGLLLTALTLIFGVNPQGGGPRLWLGCCGFYFQPSEPLKLLLIVYLAAYLADRPPSSQRLAPMLVPTVLLTGVALLILVMQRDLGTASVFIFIFATMFYLATGRKSLLIASLLILLVAGLAGYQFVGVIRSRVEMWMNPWSDPSGQGYQIVQSLMAVANGGLPGRGPGVGFPALVPIALSDFIFSAIAEEGGLVLSASLIILLAALMMRGFRVAVGAPGHFRRLLTGGIAAYLGGQSILIIGGNLRLLPLTGVTLPFVSYGGSSLLTSFLALAILLHVSDRGDDEPAPLPHPFPYLALSALLLSGLLAAALADAWWAIYRAPDLLSRTDNPRRAIADLYVRRGSILDRNNVPINETQGTSGDFSRVYEYPQLAATAGFTDPVFGQTGLEAGLDTHLRGLQGNPTLPVWWDRLLYGFPPPGLDMRTSIDLSVQRAADSLLADHKGAAVLLDAKRGEILAMASHPTFNPSNLGDEKALLTNPNSPLLNRATQGKYQVGSVFQLFAQANSLEAGADSGSGGNETLARKLGFYDMPSIPLAAAPAATPQPNTPLTASPLQMALAAASLSSGGERPPAWIALAANTPTEGWVILPASGSPTPVISAEAARQEAESRRAEGSPYWQFSGHGGESTSTVTWYLAGTLQDWPGTPLTVVVALEEDNPALAQAIGRGMLAAAIQP